MPQCVMGVDIGSSAVKAMVFTLEGEALSLASRELQEYYPAHNRVEQDPAELWEKTCAAMAGAAGEAGAVEIAGLSVDSSRCALLPLDRAGEPLGRFLTWRDTRAAECVSGFQAAHPDLNLYRVGGEQARPQHSLFKILWLQQRQPELWRRVHALSFSPADYVTRRLCGTAVISRSMAQSTGLLDIAALEWDPRLRELLTLPEGMLPALRHSQELAGRVGEAVAGRLGLPPGTPVFAGLCDATASHFGLGAVEPGMFSLSVGTSGALRCCHPQPVWAPDESTQVRVASPFGYVSSMTATDAGSVLRWYVSRFGRAIAATEAPGSEPYGYLLEQAAKIPPGSEGLLLLPHFTGGSNVCPDIGASGVFFGVRNFHTGAHFTRAILEGVAYVFKGMLKRFADNGFTPRELRFGGGGNAALWQQIVADVLEMPLSATACSHASCLGSAMAAAVGLGRFAHLGEAAAAMVRPGDRRVPNPRAAEAYRSGYALSRQLQSALGPVWNAHHQATALQAEDRDGVCK